MSKVKTLPDGTLQSDGNSLVNSIKKVDDKIQLVSCGQADTAPKDRKFIGVQRTSKGSKSFAHIVFWSEQEKMWLTDDFNDEVRFTHWLDLPEPINVNE